MVCCSFKPLVFLSGHFCSPFSLLGYVFWIKRFDREGRKLVMTNWSQAHGRWLLTNTHTHVFEKRRKSLIASCELERKENGDNCVQHDGHRNCKLAFLFVFLCSSVFFSTRDGCTWLSSQNTTITLTAGWIFVRKSRKTVLIKNVKGNGFC